MTPQNISGSLVYSVFKCSIPYIHVHLTLQLLQHPLVMHDCEIKFMHDSQMVTIHSIIMQYMWRQHCVVCCILVQNTNILFTFLFTHSNSILFFVSTLNSLNQKLISSIFPSTLASLFIAMVSKSKYKSCTLCHSLRVSRHSLSCRSSFVNLKIPM